MNATLRERLQQTKPFESLETEAYLQVVMLAQELSAAVAHQLKLADLSGPQYNALRILRGAGDAGLTCSEVGKRMVHRVPDVTRLLDRLETRGWVERHRQTEDRRVVRVGITPAGLGVIAPLDAPLKEIHERQLGHMGEKRLREFIGLLETAREQL
jgi:DNA-binding MarR family transcriptional regulator